MSNLFRRLAILVLPVAAVAFWAPATAGAAVKVSAPAKSTQARVGFGRSFRAPRARYRTRSRAPYTRGYRRPGRTLAGGILRALGIAYLFHAIFGWGAGGGSPFGLLLLVALIVLLMTRRRRRRVAYYY